MAYLTDYEREHARLIDEAVERGDKEALMSLGIHWTAVNAFIDEHKAKKARQAEFVRFVHEVTKRTTQELTEKLREVERTAWLCSMADFMDYEEKTTYDRCTRIALAIRKELQERGQ